ncbi:hypothetical protein SBC2_09380 [Caballeronia sp. SBC2]|nr:hypothetical protein SBC2_09380 [Caballeronia sp. SBC2]
MGGLITAEELKSYRPEVSECISVDWRGSKIQLSSGLNAGPTPADVFGRLSRMATEAGGRRPGPRWYVDVATAMKGAYQQRLETADDAEPKQQGCTSHIAH